MAVLHAGIDERGRRCECRTRSTQDSTTVCAGSAARHVRAAPLMRMIADALRPRISLISDPVRLLPVPQLFASTPMTRMAV